VRVGADQCTDSDTVVVNMDTMPQVYLGSDTFVCNGEQLVLDAGVSGALYVWSTGETTQSIVVYKSPQSVSVSVTDGACSATDDIELFDNCDVHVPNAFSPNVDGINDFLKVHHRGIKEFQMSVYNRWGEKIFYTSDIDEGWNGTYGNQPVTVGVYVWSIRYAKTDGSVRTQSGNVSVLK
jgi:gliding motility-associated-like protein